VNDFRTLFALLDNDPERYLLNDKCVFPCVIGRSFYQSVLPPAHVHLGWSSYAAMWISQIPPVQPDHIFVPRMTGAARFELERQAAQDWKTFLTLRAAELRSGGRLVVVLPAARDDGSSGFETIMDHAYDVLGEMVRDDAISSNERGRMALGVWPRRRRDLLAPFEANKRYCDLTIESCETSELVDPAWKGYELGGDKEALAIRHAAFYRSVFAPSLASWLIRADEPEARREFADRLERGLMQRIKDEPAPVNSLVETMV
jgi:SAM dependent carboxyl methyltransferase